MANKPRNIAAMACAIIVLLELLASAWIQWRVPRSADIILHLYTAQRILAGEILYRDIITANFPLQFYMRVPGVMLANWLGISVLGVAIAFDNIVALVSVALTLHIIRKTPLAVYPRALPCMAVALVFLMFLYSLCYNMIGQKEIFFWQMTLPYFILAATPPKLFSRALRIFIGVFAALGFCYKPFFIFPWLLVEAYLWRRERTWRTLLRAECVSCIAAGAAHLIWMFACFPEYRSVILPLARFYYEMRSEDYLVAMHYLTQLLPFMLAALVLWGYFMRHKTAATPLLHVLFLVCVGQSLAALVQMKTFMHYVYPPVTTSILMFAVAATERALSQPAMETLSGRRFPCKSALLLSAVMLGLTAQAWYSPLSYLESVQSSNAVLDRAIARSEKLYPGRAVTFYSISVHMAPVFPVAFYRHLPWDYHFYHMWLLEGITLFGERHTDMPEAWVKQQTHDAERFLRDTVESDMERLKPSVLLIDRESQLDFVKYFSQDPRFADIIRNYDFQMSVSNFDIYTMKSHE